MGNPNFEIWKEPRGFLKCLQVFLAIFAFSCATGFRGSFSFDQNCGQQSHMVKVSFKYPFDTKIVFDVMKNCSSDEMITIEKPMSERHSTEFFVVIGVFCFLLSLGMLLYYIYFEDVDAKIQAKTAGQVIWTSGPVVDFCLAVFFAFFWFVSSIAQAAAVSGVKDYSNVKEIIGSLEQCKTPNKCESVVIAKYATLTVSILLGFLNTFVWCGNTWFLWKETPWHKEPHHTTPVQAASHHQQMPPAAI